MSAGTEAVRTKYLDFRCFTPNTECSHCPQSTCLRGWILAAHGLFLFIYAGQKGELMGYLSSGLSFPQTDWINQVYLPENHARLKAAHAYVSGELKALGIPFLSRGAGLFIWVDLRKVMHVELQAEGRLSPTSKGGPGVSRLHLSPFHPPSTCLRPPLRRRCCSGTAFWTIR